MTSRLAGSLCFALVWLGIVPEATAAVARPLDLASFNVESSDAYRQTIGQQIADVEAVDLWGFTEVWDERWAEEFTLAAGIGGRGPFSYQLGETGGDDRLLLVFNSRRLRLLEHYELEDVRNPRRAAPLVAHFRVDGKSDLLFVVARLSLKDRDRRAEAQALNAWARSQTLPVVMVGSFYFGWSVEDGERGHDEAYDLLTDGGVFRWLRPGELIATQCGQRGRVQDFVFVAGPARDWAASSEILFPQSNYCPDTQTTSDHRPVRARLAFTAGAPSPAAAESTGVAEPTTGAVSAVSDSAPPAPSAPVNSAASVAPPAPPAPQHTRKELILQRLDVIQAELDALREMLEELEEY